jgi:hypothetical protein
MACKDRPGWLKFRQGAEAAFGLSVLIRLIPGAKVFDVSFERLFAPTDKHLFWGPNYHDV